MASLETRIKMASPVSFVFMGVMLAALYWYGVYDSGEGLDAQVAAKQTELNKVSNSLNETKSYLSDRAKFQEELMSVTDQYKSAMEYLPPDFNAQDLLKKIATEARSAGVNLTQVKPQTPEIKGFYEEVKMDIEMEGTFAETVSYIMYLSRLQRIVNVRNVEFSVKDKEGFTNNSPMLTMKGTVVSYRYLEGK